MRSKVRGIRRWIRFYSSLKTFSFDGVRWTRSIHILYPDGEKLFHNMPECYKNLVALALSMAHWHPLANPRGGGGADCPLCELYFRAGLCEPDEAKKVECPGCPLSEAGECCNLEGSIWWRWMVTQKMYSVYPWYKNPHANDMYRLLEKLYCEEYNRVMK